ncbi:MAG TPA: hypothetical protein DGG94_05695 [Micromonosporaceae bacterium]|nr:hypothetical protein [Micromonosporaceae bacterium]HCU49293.1 hypothetical protein [Micromonosporaceae bacterium]
MLAGVVLVVLGWLRGTPEAQVVAKPRTDPTVQPSAEPSQSAGPVLQIAGDFPKSGPGTFLIGKTGGPLIGSSGTLKRFRIAVESNVPDEIEEFTRMVDLTLADPRSWIAGKQHRFQRVAEGAAYDFTVHLVTRETAYQMCSVSGLDIRQDGVPYTSCQQVRKVIINLDRWRLSVPDYVNGGIPLETYRQYVINHEVGHELGRGHEACPGPGKPAPTMFRQTLGLKGCTANPWPYLDGKRYAGAPVP